MACMVQEALDRLAAALDDLSITLADGTVVEARGPRRGVGGNIPETPFLEVGAAGVGIDEAGSACLVQLRVNVAVNVRFGGDSDRENEILNRLFCAVKASLDADRTLGGLVEVARVAGADVFLVTIQGAEFWSMMIQTEVRYREC